MDNLKIIPIDRGRKTAEPRVESAHIDLCARWRQRRMEHLLEQTLTPPDAA